MFITAKCKKCGENLVFDIGDKSKIEVEKILSKQDFGECQAGGWHVEIGKMLDYYIVDWNNIYSTAEEAKERNKKAS